MPLAFAFGEASLRFASFRHPFTSSLSRHLYLAGQRITGEENSDKVHSTEGGELSGQMSDLRTRDVVAKMRSNFVSVDSIHFEHFCTFCLFFVQFD